MDGSLIPFPRTNPRPVVTNALMRQLGLLANILTQLDQPNRLYVLAAVCHDAGITPEMLEDAKEGEEP